MAAKSKPNLVVAYTRWIIKWRWAVIVASLALTFLAASGARFLMFDSNYRAFFSKENPQLQAFEALQDIYTKNDNILFVLAPRDNDVFTGTTLAAVEKLTDAAWKIPYAMRVDAVTNFQHTWSEEDDLIVEDLVDGAAEASPEALAAAREVALAEPLLANRIVSDQAHVTGINVTLQFPGKDPGEVTEAVAYARELVEDVRRENPDIDVYVSGMAMLNNAFSEAGIKDMQTLIPIMYIGMFLVMMLLLRSISSVIATLLVIGLSTAAAMGLAGWAGIKLTPPSATAPTMIMTMAVADSIHILISMLGEMRRGMAKREAIVESLRINMQPVFLTSLTTVIGFLSMNFSDAPPFRDLGNITATGVVAAFIFSVTFLPAMIAILPVRVRPGEMAKNTLIDRLAELVIRRRKMLTWSSLGVVLVLGAFVPTNELNDQFVEYFDERVQFRNDSDFMMENLTGVYQVEFSLDAGESNGISKPEYLKTLSAFTDWYREQPNVVQVTSFTDIMKRLNMNLHGDDPAMYKLPDERDLAAQYLLLYEMSLPFGLDLNNQVNVDKSATRFTATLANVSSREIREAAHSGEEWLQANAPAYMGGALGSGSSVMFSYISERNIRSMLGGTTLALVLISLSLIFALRSFKFGALSLIPNLIPAILGFGLWGIVVGQVGLALSVVVGMTLGIVVDDTVHFLSKYLRARREKELDPPDAVRYAFSSVGLALVVTTLILVAGFLVLSQSTFELNAGMGQLTAITIAFALLADFLLLPPILLGIEGMGTNNVTNKEANKNAKLLGNTA